MIAVYLLPVFLAAHTFVIILLLRWLRACHPLLGKKALKAVVCVLYYFCVLAMYLASLLPYGPFEKFVRIVGYYWYGISVYIVLVLLAAFIICFLVKHSALKHAAWISEKRTFILSGALCIAIIAAICIGGHINACTIHTTEYEVTVDKDGGALSELNVVLIADLHLGYNIGTKTMEQMVEKVNACNPDLILIGGDIFDNDINIVQEPDKLIEILRGMQSKYGIYAVYGNHDCQEPIVGGFTFPSKEKKMSAEGMDEFIEKCHFRLLRDEYVMIEDSIYLYGRPDEERPGRDIDERLSEAELMETMDTSKPVIVLEHEPKFLDKLSDAGVDVHLAGHTHDGQLFPLSLTCRIIWENCAGLLKKGNMTSIVTSGVGLYGPNIRVGTKSEICNIHIKFQ